MSGERHLRVAACQFPVSRDLEKNLSYVQRLTRRAAERRADILLFPEAALTDWRPRAEDVRSLDKTALATSLSAVSDLARTYRIWVAVGSYHFPAGSMKPYNRLYLISPKGDIERRYVLRPTLPTIITSFALLLITLWTGAIILETTFNWPGLGRALYSAIGLFDTPVIVGSQVIYAYLLALTVFLLDFVYALVDPRVRVGGQGAS